MPLTYRKVFTPDDPYLFQKRIRERRIELGMTRERLGEIIGKTWMQIKRYESTPDDCNITQYPTIRVIYQLCEALRTTPEYLFGMEIVNCYHCFYHQGGKRKCSDCSYSGVILKWGMDTDKGIDVLEWECPACLNTNREMSDKFDIQYPRKSKRGIFIPGVFDFLFTCSGCGLSFDKLIRVHEIFDEGE